MYVAIVFVGLLFVSSAESQIHFDRQFVSEGKVNGVVDVHGKEFHITRIVICSSIDNVLTSPVCESEGVLAEVIYDLKKALEMYDVVVQQNLFSFVPKQLSPYTDIIFVQVEGLLQHTHVSDKIVERVYQSSFHMSSFPMLDSQQLTVNTFQKRELKEQITKNDSGNSDENVPKKEIQLTSRLVKEKVVDIERHKNVIKQAAAHLPESLPKESIVSLYAKRSDSQKVPEPTQKILKATNKYDHVRKRVVEDVEVENSPEPIQEVKQELQEDVESRHERKISITLTDRAINLIFISCGVVATVISYFVWTKYVRGIFLKKKYSKRIKYRPFK